MVTLKERNSHHDMALAMPGSNSFDGRRKSVASAKSVDQPVSVAADDGSNGGLTGNIPNGTTDYIYMGNQVIEERNSSNAPIRQYVWGMYIDELIQLTTLCTLGAQSLPAGAYYLLQDLLYRAVALTNSTGAIMEAYDTDAYGNTLVFTAPDSSNNWWSDAAVQSSYGANEIIYCGYRFDLETELYYVRNRTYSPILGRWLQRDPIGYFGGVNLYEYVDSQPDIALDPIGLLMGIPSPILCTTPPGCTNNAKCCQCMVFQEGTGGCEDAVYHAMLNRQSLNGHWPDFRGEGNFCDQMNETHKFSDALFPRFQNCCRGQFAGGGDQHAAAQAQQICAGQGGKDPTGGAQFWWTTKPSGGWPKLNVRLGNCSWVHVPGCKLAFLKCKRSPLPVGHR